MTKLIITLILLVVGIVGIVISSQNLMSNSNVQNPPTSTPKQTFDQGAYDQKLNGDISKILDDCSSTYAPLEQCKASIEQIQTNCAVHSVPACSDSRIIQILNKQPVQPSKSTGDIVSQSNQQVSDYLGLYLTATQPSDIQSCADTANKMINLCNSMQGGVPSECSDPRLQQVASRR